MHSIVTIDSTSPDSKQPFLPGHTINGAPPLGVTFGHNLHAFAPRYSRALTDLIYQCLYQDPAHRPTLNELKNKNTQAYTVALDAGADVEPWENFLPQPARGPRKRKRKRKGPAPSNFHPPGTRLMFCQATLADGTQCANTIHLPVGTQYPRCGTHKIRV